MNLILVILITLIFAALWTVMTRSLIRSAIGLALTSAILTIVMFVLDAPLAAVFELSVCAGLISVLFVSTISLTHPLTRLETLQHMKDRLMRFWYLPIIVAVCAVLLSMLDIKFSLKLPAPETERDVRVVLWNLRQFDLLGQIIVLLSGVFGVVILFREKNKK
ncbi:MAG: NADH-quinone oxidoreductase subunit J [Candidatus Omnitrophica bacterium]|nr:NADH-quinone oxidoreductase subunit J [Candidatus Omnitrophota bacterium]